MATNLSVNIDLSDLMAAGPLASAGIFTHLSAAVRAVVETGEERWKIAALKAPLWEGERRAYAESISGRMTGPFAGEIVSTYKYVEDIESGRPPYDLKRMLDTSPKVRVSKKGRRYLIIPFRHNTPGNSAHAPAMHPEVHESARGLSPSRIVGHGRRLSGTGAYDIKTKRPATVRSRKYVWGDRLASEPTFKLKPHHKTDPYAGMVRFKTDNPAGGRSSSYLTFRVMAEGSSGWVIPARPGLWIARAVTQSIERTAGSQIAERIAADLT